MLVRPSNDIIHKYVLILSVIAGISLTLLASIYAAESVSSIAGQYERADVKTIKMHTGQILSDPKFAPRKSFVQWLGEKFSGWEGPKLDIGEGWTTFFVYLLIIWCLLTLVAIFIHFIWTIALLLRTNTQYRSTSKVLRSDPTRALSLEELYRLAKQYADNKSYRQAISVLMIAMLRMLDSFNIVSFHESKTNGDYIREYPAEYAGQNEFKTFIAMFEQTIYGGVQIDSKIYGRMNYLMEQIKSCAIQKK